MRRHDRIRWAFYEKRSMNISRSISIIFMTMVICSWATSSEELIDSNGIGHPLLPWKQYFEKQSPNIFIYPSDGSAYASVMRGNDLQRAAIEVGEKLIPAVRKACGWTFPMETYAEHGVTIETWLEGNIVYGVVKMDKSLCMIAQPLQEQQQGNPTDRAIKNLANEDAKVRYFAILDLKSMNTLPEPVLKMLIDYLEDLRGEYPGQHRCWCGGRSSRPTPAPGCPRYSTIACAADQP